MSDLKVKLESQIKEIEATFERVENQRQQLISQRADLDRKIAGLTEEQIRMQGDYRALTTLKGNGKDVPALEIPKGKKKTKAK